MNNQYLSNIINRLDRVTTGVTREFKDLNERQINWKYIPDTWSIGQCLDHIIVTNEKYMPKISLIAEGKKDTGIGTKIPLLPRLIGKFITKSVGPDAKMKVKAPKIFLPQTGNIRSDIVNEFQKHQNKLKDLILRSDNTDHEKTLITSPVSGFFGLYMVDAINIITLHEERHFQQAMRVLKNEAFNK